MDRTPGWSVRLKLTLSYAGFLMIAGGLLLGAVWVFLLRYVPRGETVLVHGTSVFVSPGRGGLCAISFRPRPSWGYSCWYSVSSEDGCSPAGCSPPSLA